MLSEQMDSEFKVLLYHSEVRWLSREKVMNHVFVLRAELLEILRDHNHQHAKHFNNLSFLLTLTYLANIFAALNHLNCQMQGGGVNVIEAEEKFVLFGGNWSYGGNDWKMTTLLTFHFWTRSQAAPVLQ